MTTVPTAGDEERLVARLRDGIVVQQAGPSVLIGTPDFAATVALMREAAGRLESLSTVERQSAELLAAQNGIVRQVWDLLGGEDPTSEGGQNLVARVREKVTALSASNAEAERLREALSELEAANEDLAATRSQKTYLQMVDGDGATDALIRLDLARERARALQGSAKQ